MRFLRSVHALCVVLAVVALAFGQGTAAIIVLLPFTQLLFWPAEVRRRVFGR